MASKLPNDAVPGAPAWASYPRYAAVQPASAIATAILLTALALLLILSLLAPMMMQATLVSVGGNAVRQALYLGVAGLTLVGLRPLARPGVVLAVPWPMVLALAYCAFSLSWAIDPAIGSRRLLLTFMVIWSGFAAIRTLGYARSLAVIRLVLGSAVFINIAVVLLAPHYGIHQANDVLDKNLIGDWRGFMVQKNHTAAATAFAIIVFTFGSGRLPWAVRGPVLLAAVVLLWNTGSRTSLGLCAGVVGIGLIYLLYRARYRFALLVAAIVALTACGNIVGFLRMDRLLTASSTRELLSGRTDIWDAMLRYAHDSDYLGAGYGSFWEIGGASPIFRYGNSWVVKLSQGHNGYLDLLATIGALGLVLIVVLLLLLPIAQVLSSRNAEGPRGAMILSILVFVAGHNGTESSLFDRDLLPQAMLVCALALLGLITKGTYAPQGVMRRWQGQGGRRRPPNEPAATTKLTGQPQ